MNNENLVNYKSYIKQLLLDNVDSISFNRPKVRHALERAFSKQTLSSVIDKQLNTKKDHYYSIFESAKLIRNEVLKATDWKFSGNYEGFEIPKSPQCLIKWIIVGATDPKHRNFDKTDVKVDNTSQIIMKSIKTSRQVNYKPVSPSTSVFESRLHSETPFAVGLGLHVHKETRSKKIINYLSNLGLSIDYDRVMKSETETENSVTDIINKNNGVYVPQTILKDKVIHFAINNTDLHNGTSDYKGEFHGTGQILFQKADSEAKTLEKFRITRSNKTTMKYQYNPFIYGIPCDKPSPHSV